MRRKNAKHSPSPLVKLYLLIFGALVVYLIIKTLSGGLQHNAMSMLIDALLCGMGFLGWLIFFAQFTLPVKSSRDRFLSFERLVQYLLGGHGPAIFVDNGQVRVSRTERSKKNGKNPEVLKRGPGVVILDSASAAMIRTPVEFKRAVGPGVEFTQVNEYIGGTIDLHVQKVTIGPTGGKKVNDDLFKEDVETTNPGLFRSRLDSRGFTRDNIEIIPTLRVTFRLDTIPGRGGTAFGYDATAVKNAIIGRPVHSPETATTSDGSPAPRTQAHDSAEAQQEWRLLPAYLAVDIWREYAGKFTFSELFPFTYKEDNYLKLIQTMISDRLMERLTIQHDEHGNLMTAADGSGSPLQVESREFTILRSRGLRVLDVRFLNIRMPPTVESQLVERWKASWLLRANQESEAVEARRNLMIELGKQNGTREYAMRVTQKLGTQPLGRPWAGKDLAKLLVNGSLGACKRDSQVQKLTVDESRQLLALINWLEKSDDAGQPT
ncbi:MAG: hypothetical protein HPY76_11385 [Anaerolineae bacterium]|jgi:hypothetical protein|nr:hypothetical protein [Anaerolineae bacterium]